MALEVKVNPMALPSIREDLEATLLQEMESPHTEYNWVSQEFDLFVMEGGRGSFVASKERRFPQLNGAAVAVMLAAVTFLIRSWFRGE